MVYTEHIWNACTPGYLCIWMTPVLKSSLLCKVISGFRKAIFYFDILTAFNNQHTADGNKKGDEKLLILIYFEVINFDEICQLNICQIIVEKLR